MYKWVGVYGPYMALSHNGKEVESIEAGDVLEHRDAGDLKILEVDRRELFGGDVEIRFTVKKENGTVTNLREYHIESALVGGFSVRKADEEEVGSGVGSLAGRGP